MKHLVLILLCLAAPAHADDKEHDRARRALQAGEILPLTEILRVARPGRVIEIDLDHDDGRWIYELELVSSEGKLYEMQIDAATGTILEIDREDD